MVDYSFIFWIFFIITFLYPQIIYKSTVYQRYNYIKKLEKIRGTRVILMVHRQEQLTLFGIPIYKFISMEDSEEILRAIRTTPKDRPIDLILHTPGGLVLASEQIAMALKSHKAKTTVIIPHYAMSGGSLISLAADEIIMDKHAVMGPVDPQIGKYPAASILKTTYYKSTDKISDEMLILMDISKKAIKQVKEFVYDLLKDKMSEKEAEKLAKILSTGTWTHDYPLTVSKLRDLGIKINTDVPEIVYNLLELYKQNLNIKPSVQYIPTNHTNSDNNKKFSL